MFPIYKALGCCILVVVTITYKRCQVILIMEFEFIPIDYEYFDFEGRNYVRLIGRTGDGKKVCVIDSYEPNFYVILKKGAKPENVVKKIEGIEVEKASRVSKVLKTEVVDKKFMGEDVKAVRVYVTNHKDAHDIASEIGDMDEIECKPRRSQPRNRLMQLNQNLINLIILYLSH